LDAPGRCVAKKCEFEGNLDNHGRLWTARRVLHNRRLPVRFLSHLPRKREFLGDSWPVASPYYGCIDPYLTAIAYQREHHRGSM
jgi:hypothetical protein